MSFRTSLRERMPCARAVTAAAFALSCGAALAQGVAPVPGAQLEAWLGQGLAYAGRHVGSGCHFMNSGGATQRVLQLSCPNGWAEKITGTVRVTGDRLCTSFPVPNQPPGEECVTWHALGDGRYEQRLNGQLSTLLTLLPGPGGWPK